jgi:uncharacterized DUF497 family protein
MQHIPDFHIKALIVDEHRHAHIFRHDEVTVPEVMEVLSSDEYLTIDAKEGRIRVIGRSNNGQMLTVVLGQRAAVDVYGLVTARPASRPERKFYEEHMKGEAA